MSNAARDQLRRAIERWAYWKCTLDATGYMPKSQLRRAMADEHAMTPRQSRPPDGAYAPTSEVEEINEAIEALRLLPDMNRAMTALAISYMESVADAADDLAISAAKVYALRELAEGAVRAYLLGRFRSQEKTA